jgi:tripartite-type tricarboxylate transporter receptor subunit TctC
MPSHRFTARRRAILSATLLARRAVGRLCRRQLPSKPIRFIVPYAAGGTTDLVAAPWASAWPKSSASRSSSRTGRAPVATSAWMPWPRHRPTATRGFGAISTNALNPHIYKHVPFDPRRDFTAISLLGTSTIVLEVSESLPVKTVPELIAYAKAHPGLTYATAGTGTSMHLAGAMFSQVTQTNLTHVPYKGSSPAINDMLGGHIQVMFDNLPASLPHIQAGKLRALAVAGKTRSPSLPNVPTLAEAGLPGYAVDPWFGVYGPANLPAPVVQALNAAFVEALARPDVRDKLALAGFNPKGSSAAELQTLTQTEYERFGKVAKSAAITVD